MLQGHGMTGTLGSGLSMSNCTQTAQFAYILPSQFTKHQFQNL